MGARFIHSNILNRLCRKSEFANLPCNVPPTLPAAEATFAAPRRVQGVRSRLRARRGQSNLPFGKLYFSTRALVSSSGRATSRSPSSRGRSWRASATRARAANGGWRRTWHGRRRSRSWIRSSFLPTDSRDSRSDSVLADVEVERQDVLGRRGAAVDDQRFELPLRDRKFLSVSASLARG